MKSIDIGNTRVEDIGVEPAMSAERYGNVGFPVLATPALVGLFEASAIRLLAPFLEGDEGSVGTKIQIDHTAATPIGGSVRVETRVTEVDRKRVAFELIAHDGQEQVARCSHERFVVSKQSFLKRLADKELKTS